MTNDCPVCTRPARDATVCATCGDTLATDLVAAATLERELQTTYTREAHLGTSVGARSSESPLPFHEKAGREARRLHAVLTSWAELVVTEREVPRPDDRTVAMWLAGQVEWLRHHPSGADAVRQIAAAVDSARRVIDRPPDRRWLGLCGAPTDDGECPHPVTALRGELHVSCRACGHVHDVEARRDELLATAQDQLAHASLIAAALTGLGRPIKADLVRKWAERGRLVAHGTDRSKRPLYRVGDVIDLVTDLSRRSG